MVFSDKVKLVVDYRDGDGSERLIDYAERNGVSPGTFRVWLRKYSDGGAEALHDRRTTKAETVEPQTVVRRKPAEALDGPVTESEPKQPDWQLESGQEGRSSSYALAVENAKLTVTVQELSRQVASLQAEVKRASMADRSVETTAALDMLTLALATATSCVERLAASNR